MACRALWISCTQEGSRFPSTSPVSCAGTQQLHCGSQSRGALRRWGESLRLQTGCMNDLCLFAYAGAYGRCKAGGVPLLAGTGYSQGWLAHGRVRGSDYTFTLAQTFPPITTLASGCDFYAAPRLRNDGGALAFVSHTHSCTCASAHRRAPSTASYSSIADGDSGNGPRVVALSAAPCGAVREQVCGGCGWVKARLAWHI